MQNPYKAFRSDLALGLHTWLFFLTSLTGFIFISVLLGVGVIWGVFTGFIISCVSHLVWHSLVAAILIKRLFSKSLFRFALDFLKTRSVEMAARGMFSIDDESELTIEVTIQRESRWLLIVPWLMFMATGLLDFFVQASLWYFMAAEAYFLLVGLVWMLLCRRGRLFMLPMNQGDRN